MPTSTQPATHAIVVYSDIACPWAHIAVRRLDRERRRLGLEGQIAVDHRAFPLELVNHQPTPKRILDAEVPICAELEPDAGWSQDPDPWRYPVSTLPALEAVQAAKTQGVSVSVALDRALRVAMFAQWRCLSVFAEVLDVAESVDGVDVEALWDEIRSGRPRTDVFHHLDMSSSDEVAGSPTFVLSDGSTHHNPGIDMRWVDGPGSELVIERNDPGELAELVEYAVALSPSD